MKFAKSLAGDSAGALRFWPQAMYRTRWLIDPKVLISSSPTQPMCVIHSIWLHCFLRFFFQYALLFSGESVARSPSSTLSCSSKDTIWALHDRCFLLWHACIHTRLDTRATDSEKANFGVKAWLEADALESALNKHTCTIERAFIFQAREYIFKYVRQYLPLLLLITPQHKNVYILRISALHPTCYCVCLLILWEPK